MKNSKTSRLEMKIISKIINMSNLMKIGMMISRMRMRRRSANNRKLKMNNNNLSNNHMNNIRTKKICSKINRLSNPRIIIKNNRIINSILKPINPCQANHINKLTNRISNPINLIHKLTIFTHRMMKHHNSNSNM